MAVPAVARPILDHIIILCSPDDLELLEERLQDHFVVAPGGTHADGLTVNKLVILPDGVYLEFIAFRSGIDPERRAKHWWGSLPENTIIDWAYTLRNDTQFPDIRRQVRERSGTFAYNEPQAGGRTMPDGTILKWAVAFASYAESGRAMDRALLPFWCFDKTERSLRVPFEDERWTRHPSSVVGVSTVKVSVSGTDRDREPVSTAYEVIHGATATSGEEVYPFAVYQDTAPGQHHVSLASHDKDGVSLSFTFKGTGASPGSVDVLPGVQIKIEK